MNSLGAQHPVFTIGIDIWMMGFGLMMGIQRSMMCEGFSSTCGSQTLFTMLATKILRMKKTNNARTWLRY